MDITLILFIPITVKQSIFLTSVYEAANSNLILLYMSFLNSSLFKSKNYFSRSTVLKHLSVYVLEKENSINL
jgi:hypothetical protein